MGFWGILLIALGLSMDAFAVSLTNGMTYKNPRAPLTAMFFGGFQALMPILGYYLGSLFSVFIEAYAGIIVLVILAFIGGKMIRDGLLADKSSVTAASRPKTVTLLAQAIATSIDAFAVGVGFVALKVHVFSAAALIGIVAAAITLLAVYVGSKAGNMLGNKAQILGGLILIGIGIKSVL